MLSEARIEKDPAFNVIKNNNAWLDEHPDTATELTVSEYRTAFL